MANLKYTLSLRLQQIFDKMLPGFDVWDVCCDHGYLGQNAYFSGSFKEIHFVDQAEHLIESLRHRLQHRPGFFFHPIGAELLQQPVLGNLVIAGVGAELILKIIRELKASQHLQARRLVLGPHKDEAHLQAWLVDIGLDQIYRFTEEVQVTERGRVRRIFVYDLISS